MSGCKQDCDDCNFEPVAPTVPPATVSRAFFIYLSMDNSLSGFADQNIGELATATKADLRGGVIYALRDVQGADTQLLAIFSPENSQKTYKITAKTYDENLDTSKAETLTRVWNDIQALTTADSWVVSLGSHANGWFPAAMSARRSVRTTSENYVSVGQNPMTRSLLENHGSLMDIDQLATAMEAMPKLDMLILDMCDMGGIESIYALRNTADYIVASPAEVINKGMPYDKIVVDIFNPDTLMGAKEICDKFYDLYYNFYDTDFQYGTIAVYNSSQLGDFATVMRDLLNGKESQMAAMDVSNIQSFDRTVLGEMDQFKIFDIAEFVDVLDDGVVNGSQPNSFHEALTALVINPRNTGKKIHDQSGRTKFEDKTIPSTRYSGLATYIPLTASSPSTEADPTLFNALTTAWYDTEWAQTLFN